MQKEYKFKISNVMPVYKVEKYLKEAIDSIIAQDIGFKENVQLVLVDDGSPDNCGAICDEYKAKYPDNIFVIHKENGGLSSAREAGIRVAEGEFVGFFDSDDILSPNTYRDVYNFFKLHKDEVKFVSIPMFFFGDIQGPHPLNYKFNKGSRVIDLKEEPRAIQLSMASAFFKKEDLEDIKFDYALVKAEDAKIIVDMLLENTKVGVVSTGKYMYRKHGADSRVGSVSQKKENYNEYIELFTKYIINRSVEVCGEVLDFVKETAMYDLVWTIKDNFSPILTKEEEEEYKKQVKEVLQHIDDKIIFNRNFFPFQAKIHYLSKKHNRPAQINKSSNGVSFSYDNKFSIDYSYFCPTLLNVQIKKDTVCIESSFQRFLTFFKKTPTLKIKANGKFFEAISSYEKTREPHYLNETAYSDIVFVFEIPIKEFSSQNSFSFYVSFNDNDYYICKHLNFHKNFQLSKTLYHSYFVDNGFIITRIGENQICITRQTFTKRIKKELKYILSILKNKQKFCFKIIILRLFHNLTKIFSRKKVILTFNKSNNDKVFSFHNFVAQKENKKIKQFYVINHDTSLNYYGKKLKQNSIKFISMCLKSKFIITDSEKFSLCDYFGSASEGLKDILNNKTTLLINDINIDNETQYQKLENEAR